MSEPAENPYLAPETAKTLAEAPITSEAEALRHGLMPMEAAIRAVGFGTTLVGGVTALGALILALLSPRALETALAISAVGALACLVGYSLERFSARARLGAISIAGGLVLGWMVVGPKTWEWPRDPGLAEGTLASLPLIWLVLTLLVLVNRRAAMVCSARYRQAVAATPHLKPKVARGLLIGWLLLAIMSALYAATLAF